MAVKMQQPCLFGFAKIKEKTPQEIMESKVNLQFHEIKITQEGVLFLDRERKKMQEKIEELEEKIRTLETKNP